MATVEEEEYIKRLSAMQASMPQFKSMQAKGAQTFGEMAGMNTNAITNYKNIQDKALQGFQYNEPGRLLQSDNKVEWWKERAALNSMNTIVPMMGFAVGNVMKAMPNPIAKVMGSAINWATMATTYNMNFADTLEEHQQAAGRELTTAEKQKAAVVSIGVTALDLITPIKGANATSRLLTKSFGTGGVEATKKSLIKLVNTNRQSLAKQIGVGAGFTGKMIGTEMATEAGQKAVQIGTSVTPGRLGTSEGVQDMFEEAIIAGPTVGAVGIPGAVGEARSVNRDLGTGRRLADNFNKDLIANAPSDSIEKVQGQIDIPMGKGYESSFKLLAQQGNDMLAKRTGVDIKEGAKKLTETIAFKGTAPLKKIRDRAQSGLAYSASNKILQMFQPTETGSGEQGARENFFSLKETKTGEYLKDVVNVINKYSSKTPLAGQINKSISPEMSAYIMHRIDPTKPVASLPSNFTGDVNELNADIRIIKAKLEKVRLDLVSEGVLGSEQKVEDYLTNPLSKESVKANEKGFIESLLASSERAAQENGTKALTTEEVQEIARGIVDGYDPSLRIDRPSKKDRGGLKRKAFEKSRSQAFKYLDSISAQSGHGSFREKNIEKVLTGYLQQAATRLASARVFGKDASKLKAELSKLSKLKGDEAISQKEIDRAYDLYDASHNIYKKDADKNALAASKVATTVGAITHLGLATLSSLSELAWIGERAGFGHMLATLPKAFKYAISGTRRGMAGSYIPPGESATAMATLGFNLDPRVNERLDQIFSTDQNAVLSVYFRTPLGGMLTQFTNFNRNWAAQAMMHNINYRANSMLAGDISDIEQRRLNSELKENGLTLDDFALISNAFRGNDGKVRVDITRDDVLDTVVKTETRQVSPARKGKKEDVREQDVTVRDLLIPWLHKVVDDVVVHPKANNKPLWMSDPRMAILAQLKTFPVVFGNTVVKRLLRKLNPKQCTPDYGAAVGVIGAIAMAYAFVYIGEMTKDAIKGKDFEDPSFKETLDRMGITGAVGMVGGAGRFQDGAVVSLGGTTIGALDTLFAEVITPIWNADEGGLDDVSVGGNLMEWLSKSLDGSLGAAGVGLKPFQNLFGVDE